MLTGPKGQACWEPYPSRNAGEVERVLQSLGHQLDVLRAVRARFPYIAQAEAPLGLDANTNNAIAHTVNENFVIRLCAVLDQNGVLAPPHDVECDGFEDVCIAKRLRNRFAHGRSEPMTECDEDADLLLDMEKRYGLDTAAHEGKFRLDIDLVLIPMLRGCLNYAVARLAP